jgi:hypothetical protein
VFTDRGGNRTGIIGGKLVNNIPGVQVVIPRSDQNWNDRQEPRYRLPAGQDLRITLDGSSLTRAATENLVLTGGGHLTRIDEMKINPGDRDEVSIGGDGSWIVYHTVRNVSPVLALGYVAGNQAYAVAAAAVAIKGGSTLRIAVNRSKRRLRLDTRGSEGPGGFAIAFRHFTRGGTQKFSHKPVVMRQGSVAYLRYGGYRGRKVALTVTPKGGKAHIASLANQPRAGTAALNHAVGG